MLSTALAGHRLPNFSGLSLMCWDRPYTSSSSHSKLHRHRIITGCGLTGLMVAFPALQHLLTVVRPACSFRPCSTGSGRLCRAQRHWRQSIITMLCWLLPCMQASSRLWCRASWSLLRSRDLCVQGLPLTPPLHSLRQQSRSRSLSCGLCTPAVGHFPQLGAMSCLMFELPPGLSCRVKAAAWCISSCKVHTA